MTTISHVFRRDRYTWLAYFMLGYFAYLQATLGPAMPFLSDELGLNYTVSGLHLSAFALGMVLAGLFGDRLTTRYGRSFLFWGGGFGMGLSAVLLAFGQSAVMTITSSFLMGFLGS